MRKTFKCVVAVVFGLVIASSMMAAAAGSAGPDVVTLDAVLVEAAAGTPWQIVSLSGYTILSRCPKNFTLAYARGVERARRARLVLLPETEWGTLCTPMNLILYDHEPKRSEGVQMGNPLDLSWASEEAGIVGGASIRRAHPSTVGDGDLFVTCGNYWNLHSDSSDLSIDPDSELLLKNHVPQFPAWFLAGMHGPQGLYSNRVVVATMSGEVLTLPNAIWISPAETRALQDRAKEQRRRKRAVTPPDLLPLGELFTHVAPEKNEELWNSEAALFVRWGLLKKEPDGRDHRADFLRFLDESCRAPVSEDLFTSCFGLSYAQAEKELGAFAVTAISEPVRITLPKSTETPVASREASSSEVARIVGAWARLEAKTLGPAYFDFRQECLDRAERLFRREAAKRANDVSFLVEYGLYAAQAGDETLARSDLEAAFTSGAIRPRAMVELARLRLNAAIPSVRQGFGDLSQDEFDGILELLIKTRDQLPGLLPCYQAIVETMQHAPKVPSREQLRILREATEQFPTNAAFVYSVATLYRRAGYTGEAQAIAERAMPFAPSERARAMLASVAAQ